MFEAFFLVLSLSIFDPEVILLIEKMGDKKYNNRIEAYQILEKMQRRPIFLLKIAAQNHKDIEVRTRAKRLLEIWYTIIPSNREKNIPYIGYLPIDYPNRDELLKKHLYNKDMKGDAAIYLREATLDMFADLLDIGVSKKELVELLDQMIKLDEESRNEEDRDAEDRCIDKTLGKIKMGLIK